MKKISTKINLSILIICAFVLTFVGVLLVINMSVDYYRDFEKTSKRLLEGAAEFDTADKISEYLDSQLSYLQTEAKHNYYLLEDGNIIKSSANGGMLEATDNIKSLVSGQQAQIPPITSKILDYGQNVGEYTVYILASKQELYDGIFDISVLFLQALALAVLLAAIISYIVSKRLTASVEKLAAGAKKMAEGDFEKITVTSRDEIGRLCELFNDMGAQIQKDFDEFEKVELSRREFVANVSHELKTPLTVIKSYSQTLSSMPIDEQTRRDFLGIIDSETDRMSDIVGQLLLLAKLEHPSSQTISECDVYELCSNIAHSLFAKCEQKSITIEVNGNANIKTDCDKLTTIMTNLISNAVNYSENDSRVRILINDKKIEVENKGVGIPPEDLEHIFERFYRVDRARNRSSGGTGLGLAIAKASADAIGATLYAKSEPNVLTVFTLEF